MASSPTLRTIDALVAAGLAAPNNRDALERVAARYAVALTPAMAALAAREPAIAAQFLPTAAELLTLPEERDDPIGDAAHSPVKGIVHRYRDKVLLKLTHVCAVYCRFCFRREMVGPQGHGALTEAELAGALAYIAAHPEIAEVIVTGGDPLILSARRIADVTQRVAAIGHVQRLRWHSRVPVVQPDAITTELVAAMQSATLAVRVAIHANHPAEFTAEARAAIARLADGGVELLSQSVLLAGINAEVETLEALLRAFIACGVKPYYLHHPDLAPGTSHFRLDFAQGLALVKALSQRLPAGAMPRYVIDVPGGYGKAPVALAEQHDGKWHVRDPNGRAHAYP